MKPIKPLIPALLLVPVGLLFVVIPLIISNFYAMPEFLKGFLMGFGLIIEITGFVLLKRNNAGLRETGTKDTE